MPTSDPAAAVVVNRASAARSAMWSLLENGGLALISFSSLIVYSRYLSVSDFGLFSIVLAVIELMGVLVAMLFHDALVQRRDITELHYDTAFTTTLALSALLMASCWLIAPWFAQRAGHPAAAHVLVWTALCLPLTAVSSTIVPRQRRKLDFRALAVRSLVGRSAGAIVGIVLVVLGYGFWALVAQQVLIVLFGSLVLWMTCKDRPRLRFGRVEFRQLIGFGSISVGALFLNFSIKRTFVILAGIGLGTQSAGLLNLSFRAVDTFWALAATAISQIALPILSTLANDAQRFRRAFETASRFTCAALYFCFVLIGSTSAEVVELLFGKQWIAIAPYVTILASQVVIQAWRLLMSPVLTALGRPRDLLVAQGAELIFVVAAIYIFGVPSVGWAIGMWVMRECLGGSIQAWLFRRATGLGFGQQLRGSFVPLLCAIALFVAVWACRSVLPLDWGPAARVAVLAPLGAAVYFACAYVLDRRLVLDLIGFAAAAIRRLPVVPATGLGGTGT